MKAYLELYFTNCMDVSPQAGITMLARYIYEKEKFKTSNDKRLSINTIRQELTEIAKECKYINPRGINSK